MKLSQDEVSEYNQIHTYGDDHVVIRRLNQLERIESNFILTRDQCITNWPVTDTINLSPQQLTELQRLDPEVILFATGSGLCIELLKISQHLAQSQIGCEFMALGAACRTFNLLVSEQRKVLLATSFDAL